MSFNESQVSTTSFREAKVLEVYGDLFSNQISKKHRVLIRLKWFKHGPE
jgi:hypothetical protein